MSHVFDGTVRLLGVVGRRVLLIALLLVVPYQLASSALLARVVTPAELLLASVRDLSLDPAIASQGLLWGGSVAILGLLVQVVAVGATVALASGAASGRRLGTAEALGIGLGRSGATLGGTVLALAAGLATVLVVVFLVVVALAGLGTGPVYVATIAAMTAIGLLVAAICYLVVPVAIAEPVGALGAFRRSVTLVRRSLGRILGVAILVGLLLALLAGALLVLTLLVDALLRPPSWLVEGIVASILSTVAVLVGGVAAQVVHAELAAAD